jgi:hypothetical protein
VTLQFREPLGVVAAVAPWNFPLTIHPARSLESRSMISGSPLSSTSGPSSDTIRFQSSRSP